MVRGHVQGLPSPGPWTSITTPWTCSWVVSWTAPVSPPCGCWSLNIHGNSWTSQPTNVCILSVGLTRGLAHERSVQGTLRFSVLHGSWTIMDCDMEPVVWSMEIHGNPWTTYHFACVLTTYLPMDQAIAGFPHQPVGRHGGSSP